MLVIGVMGKLRPRTNLQRSPPRQPMDDLVELFRHVPPRRVLRVLDLRSDVAARVVVPERHVPRDAPEGGVAVHLAATKAPLHTSRNTTAHQLRGRTSNGGSRVLSGCMMTMHHVS